MSQSPQDQARAHIAQLFDLLAPGLTWCWQPGKNTSALVAEVSVVGGTVHAIVHEGGEYLAYVTSSGKSIFLMSGTFGEQKSNEHSNIGNSPDLPNVPGEGDDLST